MTIIFLVKFIFKGLSMKKLILGSVLLVLVMGVANAKSYQCNRYTNGKYAGFVKVNADSESEAINKALEKYREMNKGLFTNIKVGGIKCKRSMF